MEAFRDLERNEVRRDPFLFEIASVPGPGPIRTWLQKITSGPGPIPAQTLEN